MGLFGKPKIEKALEEMYIPMFQALLGSDLEAKSIFVDMLNQAKAESQTEGTAKLPDNFGNILLEREKSIESVRTMLAKKRREGVTDADIKWWWNIHDLERRMMLKVDELYRMTMFLNLVKNEGMGHEEAAKIVGKHFPIYGDPDDTEHWDGEDRPLPYELKDRINLYMESRYASDHEGFKKELNESTSCNSLIRREFAKVNI